MSISRARVRLRWLVALVAGVATGAATMPVLGVPAAILAGWGMLAIVNVIWTLLVIWPMGAGQTREHATTEDPGRRIARAVALVGSVASLAAVVIVMVEARAAHGVQAFVLAGVAVLSVVSSWALIQTDYLLRYARIYYQDDPATGAPARGISFHQQEDPEYTDFVYFSVGLGMTYQVADTDVGRNAIRRVVIAQTMLAYMFGAGILASVINLVASLG